MTRRAVVGALGAVPLLVLGTVLVRQDVPVPGPAAVAPPERLERSERCTESYSTAALPERAFAFSGTVLPPARVAYEGDAHLRLEVDEWFHGPRLATVDVRIPEEAVATMVGQDGELIATGDQLLVSGDSWAWSYHTFQAVAWGCGWTTYADPATTAGWAQAVGGPRLPEEDPRLLHARYPAVGYRTVWAELQGVLVQDDGCLYVQDGRQRWLPVFPDGDRTRWDADDLVLQHGGAQVPLGGMASLGGGEAAPGTDAGSGFAVPEGCDPEVPRWVVGEPWGPLGDGGHDVSEEAPLGREAHAALAAAGVDAELVASSTVPGAYGRAVSSAVFRTSGVEVSVRTETPPPAVALRAYEPSPGDMEVVDVDGIEVGVVRARDAGYLEAVVRMPTGTVTTVTMTEPVRGHPLGGGDLLARVAAATARP